MSQFAAVLNHRSTLTTNGGVALRSVRGSGASWAIGSNKAMDKSLIKVREDIKNHTQESLEAQFCNDRRRLPCR